MGSITTTGNTYTVHDVSVFRINADDAAGHVACTCTDVDATPTLSCTNGLESLFLNRLNLI